MRARHAGSAGRPRSATSPAERPVGPTRKGTVIVLGSVWLVLYGIVFVCSLPFSGGVLQAMGWALLTFVGPPLFNKKLRRATLGWLGDLASGGRSKHARQARERAALTELMLGTATGSAVALRSSAELGGALAPPPVTGAASVVPPADGSPYVNPPFSVARFAGPLAVGDGSPAPPDGGSPWRSFPQGQGAPSGFVPGGASSPGGGIAPGGGVAPGGSQAPGSATGPGVAAGTDWPAVPPPSVRSRPSPEAAWARPAGVGPTGPRPAGPDAVSPVAPGRPLASGPAHARREPGPAALPARPPSGGRVLPPFDRLSTLEHVAAALARRMPPGCAVRADALEAVVWNSVATQRTPLGPLIAAPGEPDDGGLLVQAIERLLGLAADFVARHGMTRWPPADTAASPAVQLTDRAVRAWYQTAEEEVLVLDEVPFVPLIRH